MRLKFWTGLFLAALSCSAHDKVAEDSNSQNETVEDGSTPDADADGGIDDDTPDDEHWMTVRARVQVDLYTTDEEGSRQFRRGKTRSDQRASFHLALSLWRRCPERPPRSSEPSHSTR